MHYEWCRTLDPIDLELCAGDKKKGPENLDFVRRVSAELWVPHQRGTN